MTIQTTLNTDKALHPDVVRFAADEEIPEALILQVTTRAGSIEGDEPAVRVPWVADDGVAGFVPEGTVIPDHEAAFTETVVRTGKIATLGKFSREQMAQPNAARLIVNAMRRSVVKKANTAFLANAADPDGLLSLAGITDGGDLGDNLDTLNDALTLIESDGGQASHIIASPGAWAAVSKMKTGTGSAATLLGAGTEVSQRRVLSTPVLTTSAMPADTLLIVDSSSILSVVGDLQTARSEDAFFSSDVVAVRVTLRLGWAAMHPERIVKINTAVA
ncbi:hypothetical protein GCM10027425_12530 [Alteromonas gracilis]